MGEVKPMNTKTPTQPSISNGGNGHYGERLASVEAELKHVATREDLANKHSETREYLAGQLTKIREHGADEHTKTREEMSTTTRWLIGRMDKHFYIVTGFLVSILIGLILLLLKTYLTT